MKTILDLILLKFDNIEQARNVIIILVIIIISMGIYLHIELQSLKSAFDGLQNSVNLYVNKLIDFLAK